MEDVVNIRRVQLGDEYSLAHIQTESWKAAFEEIVPLDILTECTDLERAISMYTYLLAENKGNGYILELNGSPHCIAWWDVARDHCVAKTAELICIHSLNNNWSKGYGKMMMNRVLRDIQESGYLQVVLWVFEQNLRAINFYEKMGFIASGNKHISFGAVEEMYVKKF